MDSTPQHTKPGCDHSEQAVTNRTALDIQPSTRPHRVARRTSKAIGLGATAAVALLALALSGCGSTTTTTTTSAENASAVTVALTSPTSGSVIAADQVIVRGTVSPANATVQVQGQPAAVGNGVFTGTATLHGGKTTIDVIGSAPGATPDSTTVMVARQSSGGTATTTHPASAAAAATPAIAYAGSDSGETACGNELAVGPDTTCAFAEDVRSSYDDNGPGTVTAYSPVTNRTYAMSCSAGDAVVCTGGDNAAVYFPSDSTGTENATPQPNPSEATPAVAHTSGYAGETACGDELGVGADTTCAFAESVRSAYEGSGPGTVIAYSPVTHKTYSMTCSAGDPVVCTGGNRASVYFP
jgi:heat shock protein HslJ